MKKVIIIGAGPGGLTAAAEILEQPDDFSVTVLEASDAIGGISQTVRHNGNRMDIGGHRFFSKDDRIMNWWSERMPLQGADSYDDKKLGRSKPLVSGGPDPETQDTVMLIRDRVSRIYYLNKFYDYPISMKMQTFKNMGFARTMKAGFSYLKSAMFKLPETSLENFYINRFGRVLYGMFFEGYTEKLWGRHPREISADWGAQRVKGLSIRALIKDMFQKAFGKKDNDRKHVETSLIEQFWYPKYGPGQFWEQVADEVTAKGGSVLLEHCVKQIICDGDKIVSVVCDTPEGEKTFTGDVFISTMPLKDLVLGMKGGKQSDEITTIAAGLPYRDFVTVGILVERMNLKNETDIKTLGNIVPDCWIYVQETNVKLGRIQIFNNWSPYMVKDPEHTVWIGMEYFCNENDEFWNMSDDECAAYAAAELEKMGVIHKADVKDSCRKQVQKAYPAYFDTYAQIDKVIDYVNSYENLYCVGRNGQHRYNNMDHSMLTAIYAAESIKSNTKTKADIWNVNTEKEYHEEK